MAEQQSWMEWIRSYTNPAPPSSVEQNSDRSPSSDQQSPSPFGPYVRTGRGGAGNFTWQSQPEPQPEDQLEAQKPSTLSERRQAAAKIEHLDTDAALKSQRAGHSAAPQYIRVGRGYVQSSQLKPASPPDYQSLKIAPISSESNTPSAASVYMGRGGAGNLVTAATVRERERLQREQQERLAAEKRREHIAEDVESRLPAPPDAWLGGRRRSVTLPDSTGPRSPVTPQ